MIQTTLRLFISLHRYLLIGCWLLMESVLFFIHKVEIVHDSRRYIFYAKEIAFHNHILPDINILYLGYTAFLAVFLKLGIPVEAAAAVQVAASGLAAVCLYKVARAISGNTLAAFLATLLFVCWPDLQAWNFYIHTESLFTSLLIIYINQLFTFTKSRNRKQLVVLLALFSWLLLLRPNGIIVGFATLVYFLGIIRQTNARLFWQVTPVLVLALGMSVAFTIGQFSGSMASLLPTYQSGSLFGGHPFMALHSALPPYVPDARQPFWLQLLFYIKHDPVYFGKLFLYKLVAFFAQIKPYYSLSHNMLIVFYIYPLYILAVVGWLSAVLTRPQRLFFAALLAGQAALSAATLPDWDNRFIAPILPVVFLLAAVGAATRISGIRADAFHTEAT